MVVRSDDRGTVAKFRFNGKEYAYTDRQRHISFRQLNENTPESTDTHEDKVGSVYTS
jgi:hypothetical protein